MSSSNTTQNLRAVVTATLVGALALPALACRGARDGDAHQHGRVETTGGAQAEAAKPEHGAHQHGEDEHAAHGDDAEALERLVKVSCEHGTPIIECADCRYEVGVVEVAPALLDPEADDLLRVATAGRAAAREAVTLNGEVGFDERRVVHVSPRIEGTARRVHVDLGEHVAKGALLVEIDSLELGRLRSSYLQARARLARAEQDFAREERLHAKRITAASERLQAETALAEARADLQAAESQLELLGYDRAAREALRERGAAEGGRLLLRAPLAGTVVSKHVVTGEQVAPDHELFTVADLTKVWIWASVYERDLARVLAAARSGGARATARVAGFPGQTFGGRLDYVGATMDEATRTVKARIAVDNAEELLRPGMFAEVEVALGPATGALLVPADAVVSDGDARFVFVRVGPSRFMRRAVEVGAVHGGQTEIVGGLREGEALVVQGAFLLKSDILREKMGAGCAD